ncbi:MAG: hypothetical protein CM1200mP8_0100 [Chloroflexota bacterium]|nr:MAG: hypothetical protein CM1200mP8_0100 [Chloroflexota bacterium]
MAVIATKRFAKAAFELLRKKASRILGLLNG